ncbi:hypothetical protein SCOR_01295 [Sulfidibacter corallicola]|uniref:Uncharacterized protein n=1 Tax=Sulfidibacter corallicola TaxID=2818388 RepID=A0A8A4TJ59_SULCO|nr:hypothetical protein [Sulfidibacter corallicola]QTD48838.1 hypothetical protein J3U87_24920 [Sulfidibacter corallicola]
MFDKFNKLNKFNKLMKIVPVLCLTCFAMAADFDTVENLEGTYASLKAQQKAIATNMAEEYLDIMADYDTLDPEFQEGLVALREAITREINALQPDFDVLKAGLTANGVLQAISGCNAQACAEAQDGVTNTGVAKGLAYSAWNACRSSSQADHAYLYLAVAEIFAGPARDAACAANPDVADAKDKLGKAYNNAYKGWIAANNALNRDNCQEAQPVLNPAMDAWINFNNARTYMNNCW